MDNYSDKLLDYVTGNLPIDEEEELFEMLSKNPEIREELRNFTFINSALKSSSVTLMPPLAVTANIFKKAGFSVPSKIGKYVAGASAAGLATSFFSGKVFAALATAIIATASTIFVMNEIDSNDSLSAKSEKISRNLKQPQHNMPEIILDIPTTIAADNDLETNEIINSDIYTENIKTKSNNISMAVVSPFAETTSNISQINISKANSITESSEYSPFTYSESWFAGLQNIGLSLEIKNSTAWNLPKETIYPSEQALLNNMDMFLFYELNPQFSIGLGIKQETFFVQYTGSDDTALEIYYEQNPNLTNLELALRYRVIKTAGFEPFVGVNFGGSSYGLIGRASLGNHFRLTNELGLTMSIDYSKIFFRHQSRKFTADKIGINYGIIYKF